MASARGKKTHEQATTDSDRDALHVQVEKWLMERYKKMAKELGISMRGLVMLALDDAWRKYSAEGRALAQRQGMPPESQLPVLPESDQLYLDGNVAVGAQLSLQQAQRLNRLEMRVDQIESSTRGLLRAIERRGKWRHTHNASVRGTITNLYGEPYGEFILLYEREASRPTWIIATDGRLERLDGNEPGVAVEVA